MFLDIIQIENCDEQLNFSLNTSPNTSELDTWKKITEGALVTIFRNGTISLTGIMQLLEFTVSQILEVLLQKNISLACALFDWMVVTMQRAPIGPNDGTIDRWLIDKGGWIRVIKSALESNIHPTTPKFIQCENCKRLLAESFGFLKQQCECGTWICLYRGCSVSFSHAPSLRRHILQNHVQSAKSDECLHCGSYKDRRLNKCRNCGAFWCVNGDCNFETRFKPKITIHKRTCGIDKKKFGDHFLVVTLTDQPATEKSQVQKRCLQPNSYQKIAPKNTLMSQAVEQSGIERMLTGLPQPSCKELGTSSHVTTCGACQRQIETPFGIIRQKCACGKWICSIKNCGSTKYSGRSLSVHQWNYHFYASILNKCVHCGNFKSRCFKECATCHALWCTNGECRYETLSAHAMKLHTEKCNGTNTKHSEKHKKLPQ